MKFNDLTALTKASEDLYNSSNSISLVFLGWTKKALLGAAEAYPPPLQPDRRFKDPAAGLEARKATYLETVKQGELPYLTEIVSVYTQQVVIPGESLERPPSRSVYAPGQNVNQAATILRLLTEHWRRLYDDNEDEGGGVYRDACKLVLIGFGVHDFLRIALAEAINAVATLSMSEVELRRIWNAARQWLVMEPCPYGEILNSSAAQSVSLDLLVRAHNLESPPPAGYVIGTEARVDSDLARQLMISSCCLPACLQASVLSACATPVSPEEPPVQHP